jgi:hypothetical protein
MTEAVLEAAATLSHRKMGEGINVLSHSLVEEVCPLSHSFMGEGEGEGAGTHA